MSTLDCRAFLYVIPTKAEVTVIDSDFHKMGDVNWDGVIDSYDYDLMVKALPHMPFPTYPDDSAWNPDCDLTGDGTISVEDFIRVVHNQDKKAPSYYTPFNTEVSKGKLVAIGKRGRQTLKATAFMASTKKILFFFSAFGMLGRPIVR